MGFSLTCAVWMSGIHSIIQGICGIVLVLTSHYVNFSPEVNYVLTGAFGILIVLGIFVFCVIVCRLPICAMIFGGLFGFMSIAISICLGLYLGTYFNFYANSIFDIAFLYSDNECWVGPDHVMTVWHFLTVFLMVINLLWCFYMHLLCKYARCACCLPCPPRSCYKTNPCPPPPPCCQKVKWYKKLWRTPRASCCPPPCPQPCPPPCAPPCPPPCPPPCSPCPRKAPKFVLTLRPGRTCK